MRNRTLSGSHLLHKLMSLETGEITLPFHLWGCQHSLETGFPTLGLRSALLQRRSEGRKQQRSEQQASEEIRAAAVMSCLTYRSRAAGKQRGSARRSGAFSQNRVRPDANNLQQHFLCFQHQSNPPIIHISVGSRDQKRVLDPVAFSSP